MPPESEPSFDSAPSAWTILKGEYEAKPIFLRKNLAAEPLRGEDAYAYRAGVAVPLVAHTENGLPTPDEMAALDEIEEALLDALQKDRAFVMVLVITTNGIREFVFYGGSAQVFDARLKALQARFPKRSFQGYATADPGWTAFDEFQAG